MTQSTGFYALLLGLLSITSTDSNIKKVTIPVTQERYVNKDSIIAVNEYIATQNLAELKELNK